MTPEQEILSDLIDTTHRLKRSASAALAMLGGSIADEAAYLALSPEHQITTTALLKLFEQLEGTMSGLFRAILRTLGVRLKGLYPLDVANRMAELGVIDEPDRWVAVVKLRNELAHEYPIGSGDRYDRVCSALNSFPFLFEAADRVDEVVRARALLDLNR